MGIHASAGIIDASKWVLQDSGNVSDYDNWHCNVLAYQKLADKIEEWMRIFYYRFKSFLYTS